MEFIICFPICFFNYILFICYTVANYSVQTTRTRLPDCWSVCSATRDYMGCVWAGWVCVTVLTAAFGIVWAVKKTR